MSEWTASRPGRFTPGGNSYDSPWMDTRWASQPMWTLWEINKIPPPRESKGVSSTVQPQSSHYTDNAIRAVAVKIHASIIINNTEYFFGHLCHTQHFGKTSITKQIIEIVDVIKICHVTQQQIYFFLKVCPCKLQCYVSLLFKIDCQFWH